MGKHTKISLGILLAAIVAGFIMLIPGTGFPSFSMGLILGGIAEIILIPCGIIISLIAIAKEKESKLLPALILSAFLIPVIVFFGKPIFEMIEEERADNRVSAYNRIYKACEIMAGKELLFPINDLEYGHPIYILDVALVNYNDTIENGELLYQIEELYVNASYKKLKRMSAEIPFSICKKRVRFTPSRDIDNRVRTNYYLVECYDISCTGYIYKNGSCTKSEDTDGGHSFDVDIYVNLFTHSQSLIYNSEITLIYEDADSLSYSEQ